MKVDISNVSCSQKLKRGSKGVKIFCDTTHFPLLTFYFTYAKPHTVRGSIKHDCMQLDPNMGHEKCEIIQIPCTCFACTSM